MSCEECEKRQNIALDKNIAETTEVAYIRIQEANVALVGCEKHLGELIRRLEHADNL